MPSLLVIDDDPANCQLIARIFRGGDMEIASAGDGPAGLATLAESAPDVVLLDMQMPGMDGLAVLESIRNRTPDLPVIMLTGDREVKSAIRATRLGAVDYLMKPVDADEVLRVVHRAIETSALRKEVETLRARDDLAARMGTGPQIRELVGQVKLVASTSFTVLILGETGTGKELVAQAIHRDSHRRGPFVALDCGAIPEALIESELFGHQKGAFTGADRTRTGHFQLAQGGTLFLDEIGNLPVALQSKLLRVLESKEVLSVGSSTPTAMDVRFIAATNDDLKARASAGHFRSDLYFRLAQYTIPLPPLRDRRRDIAYLATRFVDEVSVELRRPVLSFLPEAMQALEEQPWPGNVRELRNVVRQAVLRSKDLVIRREDVETDARATPSKPAPTPAPSGAVRSLKEVALEAAAGAERTAICDTLRATNGNQSEAARTLQTDNKTLHAKIRKLGIRVAEFMK